VTFNYTWYMNHQRQSVEVNNPVFQYVPQASMVDYGPADLDNGLTTESLSSGNVNMSYDGNHNLTYDGTNTLSYDVEIVVDTIVNKYTAHLPLYRQSALLERDCGIEITRATMYSWVMQVGEMLSLIVSAMRKELLAGGYIQTGETPVDVQTHDKRGKKHQAYLWQYGTPGGLRFSHEPRTRRAEAVSRRFRGDSPIRRLHRLRARPGRARDGALNGQAASTAELTASGSRPSAKLSVGRLELQFRLSAHRQYRVFISDPQSPSFANFHGLDWYPINAGWRV
jgi:hypothetical protein